VNVPTNEELAVAARNVDPLFAVRRWLSRHVSPPHPGQDRNTWLDWAAMNFLNDPEIRACLTIREHT
jgi:hypothetical protein